MSPVLHPVGPEPPQTYWVRRAIVIAAAILVLAVVVALIVNGSTSGQAAEPPAQTPATTAATSATSPSPSGLATSATAQASGKSTGKASASSSPTAVATSSMTANPGPVACAPEQLRVTLTGKKRLKVKKKNTFQLSVINGSGATCIVKLDRKNFELKIYSGTDRIWSSNDCTTAVKPINKKLAAERTTEWSMTWNGRRSRDNCKNRPEIPRAGTYFATAQLKGAKPVQLRMILRG